MYIHELDGNLLEVFFFLSCLASAFPLNLKLKGLHTKLMEDSFDNSKHFGLFSVFANLGVQMKLSCLLTVSRRTYQIQIL